MATVQGTSKKSSLDACGIVVVISYLVFLGQNLGLISRVVVVGLAGIDCETLTKSLSQLPFFSACSSPRSISYYRGLNPRRMLYSLLFYPPQKGRGGGEESDDDSDGYDEDDEEEEAKLGAGDPANDLGLDPVEKYVLTLGQLKTWGYLLPPDSVVEGKGEATHAGDQPLPPPPLGGEEDLGESLEASANHYGEEDSSKGSALAWLDQGAEGSGEF